MGRGSARGKGFNSRYGGYWKLEKVFFFYESVSTILQLIVAGYVNHGVKRGNLAVLQLKRDIFVDAAVIGLAFPIDRRL